MPDAPITNLQVVQRGWESTPGTSVAAVRRVMNEPGSVDLSPIERDTIRRRYPGSLATSHQSSPGLQRAGIAYESRGYYDELALDLTMFFGNATITGASADKTWAFTAPDASDTLRRCTYEIGGRDTWAEEEELAGCVGNTLTITWNKSDDWMEAIDLMAMRNVQAAKTAAIGAPSTLVPILGRYTRVWIDPTTIGTTSYGRGISGEIRLESGLSRRYGTDGNDYPNRIALIGPRVAGMSLIVEYDATTLRTAWRNGTVQKVRVSAPGPSLGSTAYNAIFNMVGTFDTNQIDEDDGIATLALDLVAEYDSGLGADVTASIVCSLTAIP